MKHKLTKNQALEEEESDGCDNRKYFRMMQAEAGNNVQGTSTQSVPGFNLQQIEGNQAIRELHVELSRNEINVEEVGKIISEAFLTGILNEAGMKYVTKVFSKNISNLGNINIVSLANNLNRGVIDSRHAVVGNAFLWNLLKNSMTNVREKFENYSIKSTIGENNFGKIDFNSKYVSPEEFIIESEGLFQEIDLLAIFHSITFRKSAALIRKAKQIVKTYLCRATYPKCAIWHYSLRLSGSSHKKTIQDIPLEIVRTLIDFLLALAGLGRKEFLMEFDQLDQMSMFYESLGDSTEEKEHEFYDLKALKDQLIGKFRICIAEALNEVREMPFNIRTRELQPPPRGKPLESHCVTWKQYEDLIKKCVENPSTENLKAKEEIEVQMEYDVNDPVLDDLKCEENLEELNSVDFEANVG